MDPLTKPSVTTCLCGNWLSLRLVTVLINVETRSFPELSNQSDLGAPAGLLEVSSIKKLIAVTKLKQGGKKAALILPDIGLPECYHQLRRPK